jgi:putative hemolysin
MKITDYRLTNIISYASAVVILLVTCSCSAEAGKWEYTGVKTCARCHGMEEIGNQYAVWQTTPHARAQRNLSTARAVEIAEKAGIKNPGTDKACLKCHTTGGGQSEHTADEGVGCESCHGPGSAYHEASAHVDYSDRRKGYITARKNGMYPVLGIEHLKNREKLCLHCHNDKRPCIPDSQEALLRIKMTIQVVDTLRRGEVNIRHPLRR